MNAPGDILGEKLDENPWHWTRTKLKSCLFIQRQTPTLNHTIHSSGKWRDEKLFCSQNYPIALQALLGNYLRKHIETSFFEVCKSKAIIRLLFYYISQYTTQNTLNILQRHSSPFTPAVMAHYMWKFFNFLDVPHSLVFKIWNLVSSLLFTFKHVFRVNAGK